MKGQFNFAWLFALIVGAVILVLAIYGALRIGDTQRFQTDTEVAQKIEILTNPLQAGFSEGSFGRIIFNSETKINNICFSGGFGKNDISVSTRSGIGEEWNLAGGAISVHNKYIFSGGVEQGEEFYVFSKPFYYPFRVSDLVFMTPSSEVYCFVDVPSEIGEEVVGLNVKSIRVENCSESDVRVCFGSGCSGDVRVVGGCVSDCGSLGVYSHGYVEKYGEKFNYVGSLMYGAIFSDKGVYDCNVGRLMYRLAESSNVFREKAQIMDSRGCNTDLNGEMAVLAGEAMNATEDDFIGLYPLIRQIDKKNEREACGLF